VLIESSNGWSYSGVLIESGNYDGPNWDCL
jgi:hypothetical protein